MRGVSHLLFFPPHRLNVLLAVRKLHIRIFPVLRIRRYSLYYFHYARIATRVETRESSRKELTVPGIFFSPPLIQRNDASRNERCRNRADSITYNYIALNNVANCEILPPLFERISAFQSRTERCVD